MRWVWLVLVVLLAVVLTAFTLQNSSFRAPLQLDLCVAAWKLRSPVGVPLLMWSSFGAGALLAGGWFAVRASSLARKVRQLEQEIAMAAPRAKDPWAGT